jgi:alpha-L-arabinofuranosidase
MSDGSFAPGPIVAYPSLQPPGAAPMFCLNVNTPRRIVETLLLAGLAVLAGCISPSQRPELRSEREPERIVVDASVTLHVFDRPPVGINVNYLTDSDVRRPVGSRLLASALTELGIGFVRFPGGEKSDAYLWSVSPYSSPRPTLARTGPNEWPSNDPRFAKAKTYELINPLDFDAFVAACRAAGAEPVVVVCYDSIHRPASFGGTAPTRAEVIEAAREWVRYANVTRGYGIRYWEIGNETDYPADTNYNGGNPGSAGYAADLVDFSRAMKSVDPTIRIGANGNSRAWFDDVLARAAAHIDYLVVHHYPTYQWTRGYDEFRLAQPNLASAADMAIAAIRAGPAAHRSRIQVAVTEVNAIDWSGVWPNQNDLGHALVLFDLFGQHLSRPEVSFTLLWNTRWVDAGHPVYHAFNDRNELQPTGRALAIWGQFLHARMVRTTSTFNVRAYASRNNSNDALTVFLLNKHNAPLSVDLALTGFAADGAMGRWEFSGAGPSDPDPRWRQLPDAAVAGSSGSLALPATSITVLRFSRSSLRFEPSSMPLTEWLLAAFGSLNDPAAAVDADPDHDGLPNLLEFALGSSPIKADASPLRLSAESETNRLQLAFRRPHPSPAGVQLIAEASDSPSGPWRVLPPAAWSIRSIEADWESVMIVDLLSDADASRRFMRLRAERSELAASP